MTETIEMTTELTPILPPNGQNEASTAITSKEYGGFEFAFTYLSAALFGKKLPDVMITLQRKSHSGGYFSANRFKYRHEDNTTHEIALNPDAFIGRDDMWVISVLLHEMVHLWQQVYGKPSARGYHNREWASKMKSVGLMPSNTGAVGGRETGQQMSHYILPNGPFAKAFAELEATGWQLNLESAICAGKDRKKANKATYVCPACEISAWGKPDLKLTCTECLLGNLPNLSWLTKTKTEQLVELIFDNKLQPQIKPDEGSAP